MGSISTNEKTQRALASLCKAVGTRRGVLVLYLLASALACLWVPWNVREPTGRAARFKHGFVFSPPQGYRTFPSLPKQTMADEAMKWSDAAKADQMAGDLKSAAYDVRMMKFYGDKYREESQNFQKLVDQYERTSIEVRWGELFLELVVLAALCGAALLVIGRRADPE